MPPSSRILEIQTTQLLPLEEDPTTLNNFLRLEVNDHTYAPKVGMFRHDWVASVALPAFRAYAAGHRDEFPVKSFCAVGTGAGVDVLAAAEIFDLSHIVVTDLHADVVDIAVRNIKRSFRKGGGRVKIEGRAGDLLTPLAGDVEGFDLIYENLPNIPLLGVGDVWRGQNSSSFFRQFKRSVPGAAHELLLELHAALLNQARSQLLAGGRVLCSIGCRVSLDKIHEAIEKTGYTARPLVFTWKVQTEAMDVVHGYAEHERRGLGPFHFYPVSILMEMFRGISPAWGAEHAWKLEKNLRPWEITATEALDIVRAGSDVGHTAVVIEATPIES